MLGDWFGWRNVFFVLAALFALATSALWYEFVRNPITHAGHAAGHPARGFIADYKRCCVRPGRARSSSGFLENGMMFGAFAYVGADLHLRFGLSFSSRRPVVGAFATAA